MPRYNVSVLMKELRNAKGFTQAQLAEGICSRQTIVKIESGERKADWYIMQAVFLRLGMKQEDIQGEITEMLSADEAHVIAKRDECQQFLATGNMEALKTLLEEMQADKRFAKDGAGRGYLIYARFNAGLHLHGAYKDTQKCLRLAMECLSLTRDDFDINKIPEYFLSLDELMTLNMVALAYADIEGINKAIEIWFKLKENYEKQFNIGVHETPRYRELVLNICVALRNAERYEECLTLAEEGLKNALTHHEMRTHLIFYRQKAWCLMKLGREEEGREWYKKFIMLAYVMNGYATVSYDLAKQEYEATFGEQLDLSLTW
ncbi:MAG: helix-turn-helix transcriptional regulator [Defluviitaleaceae bacterium]|nr:helix-turn-helix transcriptional regulator [Defluviitaleaceae bacterium]MCL2275976.1 helix-turn-helix transcriptional regulator [Defluviitaleaceae bacterium]